jgi:hypothetical protein
MNPAGLKGTNREERGGGIPMSYGGFRVRKKPGSGGGDKERSMEDLVREMKGVGRPREDYRERSLKIHGLICAKCAREFEQKDRHLLTVHHRDGNHRNNPPDGSNWENLCVYCHEDEHSRGLLGDYLSETK